MGVELGGLESLTGWVLLAAAPLLLAACTAFTKISIVIAALRLGLGAERLLPFGSMLALALALTAVVMAPVAQACSMALELHGGLEGVRLDPLAVGGEVLEPLWAFLAEHAREREIELFAELSDVEAEGPAVLVPAFLVSEIGHGLELAVMILMPFVVVDLICAQALALLGLGTTPTSVVALPAKILLFLAADGWQIVILGLVEGYR